MRCNIPEGPECCIFKDNLINTFDNQNINAVEIIGGRYLNQEIPKLNELKFPLMNIKFHCKGKFIYWRTNRPDINLCFTLGMTGAFAPYSKHSAIRFVFDSGDIFFNDPRRFGTFRIFDQKELNDKLNSLGWDVLQDNIPNDIICKTRTYNKLTIAELLMDQHIQSGIGNYAKSELCYRAKILPTRLVSSLSDEEIILLYKEAKNILNISYQKGGASIKSFTDMYGNIGKFFDDFQVYGKKTDPMGNPVTKTLTKDSRTTFFVEGIQV